MAGQNLTAEYFQATDPVVGRGHATKVDSINRALRKLLSLSGLDPDAVFTGLAPIFNPMAFGAIGDDTADDTAAVQAAIDAAGAATPKGIVEITRTHKVSATANTVPGASGLYALLVPTGVQIDGRGRGKIHCVTDGATVIAAAGASSASHVTDVAIRYLAILGGDVTNNLIGRGVYFFRADRCSLVGCDISGVRLAAQADRNSADSAYNVGIKFLNNHIHDTFGTTGGNGSGLFLSGCDKFVVSGNVCTAIAEHGMYLSQDLLHGTVTGNVCAPSVNTNLNCGIQVFTSTAVPNISHLTISNNTVIGGKWGILASTTNGKIKKLTLAGNTVTGCLTAGVLLSNVVNSTVTGAAIEGTTAGSGIECDNCRSITLSGCDSTLNFGYGVLFVDSPNCQVSGGNYNNNDTGLNGNAGIRFATSSGGSTGGRVTGAICTDDQGSKTQGFGIQIDATSTNCTLTDTDVSGNRSGAIQHNSAVGTDIRNCRGYNPGGPSAVTVTASPMTYTNNDMIPETLAVMGGTVSSITKGGVTIATATNAHIRLAPGQAVVVTYSVAPTMAKDIE